MPSKSHPRAKSSRDSNTKKQRDLRAKLLNTFLQWRDHRSCSKEARAVFNAMAESVADITFERLRAYFTLSKFYANSTETNDCLAAAEKETLKSVRDGTFKPKDADHYVWNVAQLTLETDSVMLMAAIKNGDQEKLRDFTGYIASYRTDAFERLEEAGLVIRHTQPNSLVRLEWPEPNHPAAAAYLATIGTPLRLVPDR
jgi:hypothetical protein